MKTKKTFKVWIPSEKRYIEGWQDLQRYSMGIMSDRIDPKLISICFFDEGDDYFHIEEVNDDE